MDMYLTMICFLSSCQLKFLLRYLSKVYSPVISEPDRCRRVYYRCSIYHKCHIVKSLRPDCLLFFPSNHHFSLICKEAPPCHFQELRSRFCIRCKRFTSMLLSSVTRIPCMTSGYLPAGFPSSSFSNCICLYTGSKIPCSHPPVPVW